MSRKNSREAKRARREAKQAKRAAREAAQQQWLEGMKAKMRSHLEELSLAELKEFIDGMRNTGEYNLPPKSKCRTRAAIIEAIMATAPEFES